MKFEKGERFDAKDATPTDPNFIGSFGGRLHFTLLEVLVGTASATSPIPRHLCISTLMASHAVINLCPRQACSYPLFHLTTTWYYSLILHYFLYHHFLHDSLTTRFCTFPVPLYLVIFVSCPSDVVPHLSATSEVSYFIYMILCPISYWLCTCSYHIYRWIYLDVVPHLSATSELSYLQIPPHLFCV